MTYQATTNAFDQERKETDLNLVTEITQILQELNHQCPTKWLDNKAIIEIIDQPPKLQRFIINRYWRTVIGVCKENTVAIRYCLTQEGTDEIYLKIFKSGVAPFIIKYNL